VEFPLVGAARSSLLAAQRLHRRHFDQLERRFPQAF